MTKIYHSPDPDLLQGSTFYEAVNTDAFVGSSRSTVALGHGVLMDIEKCPHVLIAGESGSGKSVMMHNVICSLLLKNSPNTMQMLLIDPKRVEFKFFYKDSPCLFCPVVTEPEEALQRLEEAANEMMNRYDIMEDEGKRFWTGKKLYIVIDEIADLVSTGGKRLEKVIEKIARLGRGAGVHLIVATQHPTAHVLSRQITTNLDTRICLRVNDASASRLILGESGGEKLKGRGDAIIRYYGETRRFQGAYIDDSRLEAYSHSWRVEEKVPQPQIIPDILTAVTTSSTSAQARFN